MSCPSTCERAIGRWGGGRSKEIWMDTDQIKCLIELMVANDLNRIEIREGDTHILLKRGELAPVQMAAPMAAPLSNPGVVHGSTAAPVLSAPPPPQPVGAASNESLIRSPMVGTFYASPDPESPAFVKVGDPVSRDTVVCLIEAMKVFNEIRAEVSGRVARILAHNGQAVEYDQPLIAVVPE